MAVVCFAVLYWAVVRCLMGFGSSRYCLRDLTSSPHILIHYTNLIGSRLRVGVALAVDSVTWHHHYTNFIITQTSSLHKLHRYTNLNVSRLQVSETLAVLFCGLTSSLHKLHHYTNFITTQTSSLHKPECKPATGRRGLGSCFLCLTSGDLRRLFLDASCINFPSSRPFAFRFGDILVLLIRISSWN